MRRFIGTALVLFCTAGHADPIGPFVFRVCRVTSVNAETLISRPVDTKPHASWCVVFVPCGQADFEVFEDTHASITHYTSKDVNRCR